jgi:probable rRNA maturation factor
MNRPLTIHHQVDCDNQTLPSPEDLCTWCAVLQDLLPDAAEVSVRFVNDDSMSELNQTYRGKAGPTNVLSFPDDDEFDDATPYLGDIAICAPQVEREAAQLGIAILDHYAHLTLHGLLHLLGYDHIDTQDAKKMEALEIEALNQLNIANPYTGDLQTD